MELPTALRGAVENGIAGADVRRMAKLAEEISERYRNAGGRGSPLVTRADEALTYAAVRMPATYGAARSALSCALDAARLDIHSLIDAGAGTGTATWAASELLDLGEITCIEGADAMLELGRSLMSGGPAARWVKSDLASQEIQGKADLVIASYALNELAEDRRLEAVGRLWNAAGKMLLLIEPGTPAHFHQLMRARDTLLGLGAHVAAPCPHGDACPLPEGDWCHFSCRIARGRLHKRLKGADVPYEDEKFSYVAFVRDKPGTPRARVIRHPSVEKGRITVDACGLSGLERRAFLKRDGEAYKMARKLVWGDSLE
jgi:ribosomal protein RSM22 (predicted rRNA methylase)